MVAVRWFTGFLDSPSPASDSFWCAVTGSVLSEWRDGGRFATLVPAGGDPFLRVQVIDAGPPSCHLDLHVDDVRAAARELAGFVVADRGSLVVCRSPAGLPFCLVPAADSYVRPGPVDGALVDQMCLDVPRPVFDREAAFWAGLISSEVRETDLPEFARLRPGAGLALRLLLQRTGGPAAGMHLDFAAVDVAATVERQVGLGASVVRVVPGQWTTLRDPAGREYCVTARPPVLS
ncbi:VOC family protein [Actinoplanes sp. NBRC 103695]|uniref:VOC family protein n=1 Tax=Actinoplanes sp. NBRC 103695 TaxID=3032202 RepID=UPI0024A34B61|nr:VOC family protein [Actinoplanes sp. NBRC 103695]GLY95126.1 hypothetical protein Acsp02_23810 [Actinoplanes sp. NBRC 103695]